MKYGIELGYVPKINIDDTSSLIDDFYNSVFLMFKEEFDLRYINSAILTTKDEWLNDDFNGSLRPIDFDIPDLQIFSQSLLSNNKWRRKTIMNLGIEKHLAGIMTLFSTIVRDIKVSNISSITYNELGIELFCGEKKQEDVMDCLIKTYSVLYNADKKLSSNWSELKNEHITKSVRIISYNKLKKLYPFATFQEKLNLYGKEFGSFILTDHIIPLINSKSGIRLLSEDIFDFDSFCSLYIYNWVIESTVQICYAAHQVDREVLKKQHALLKENWKTSTKYNYAIKSNVKFFPLTISIGVDINRFLMFVSEKQHVAEVHSSVWPNKFVEFCKKNNINIF